MSRAIHASLLPTINHVYMVDGKKETLATLLQGPKKEIQIKALSNEIGCLAQGNKHDVKSTDTIEFILKSEVPNGHDITYATFVCDYRPLKENP